MSLLAGIALAEAAPGWGPALAGFLVVGGVCLLPTRIRAGARLALLGAATATGGWLGSQAAASAAARIDAWLPPGGSPVSLHLVGTVLDAPEVDADGGRRLRLARARPEDREARFRGVARVALRIPPPPDPGGRDEVDGLRRGDRVRVFCRVRRPPVPRDPDARDPRRSLLARGIDATGHVKSARLVELVSRGTPTPTRVLCEVKARARGRLERAFGERASRAVLAAMLLGDRAALDAEVRTTLRDGGLVHLLSISGLHVGLVVLLLLALARQGRLGPVPTAIVLGVAISGFGFLVGGQAPVLRAAGSAGVLLAGRAIGRDGEPLNTLALVAAALAALHPHGIYDIGYQLSFLATAGILGLAPAIGRALPLPKPAALALGVSIGAYLASAPAVAWHFGRAAPASLLTNLVAAPLCGLVLALGSAAMALEGVPIVGAAVATLADGAVRALIEIATAASRLPGGSFRIATPPLGFVALYYALLAAAAAWARAARRGGGAAAVGRVIRLGVALALGALHVGPPPPGPAAATRVTVLDVGQAQAVLLRGPSGGFVLVDAGGSSAGRFDAGERIVAPRLASAGCRRVEVMLVSHEHDDHAGGVSAILRDFEVGELWLPEGAHRTKILHRFAAAAVERGVAVRGVGRGFRARRAGLDLEALHPARSDSTLPPNDRSVVLRAVSPTGRVLVPGDLEIEGERRLAAAGVDLEADALVVGHHGGGKSTTPVFLDRVRPKVAVISAGAGNRFGHPAASVIDRLRAAGARVYRTDENGSVTLELSARGWSARTAALTETRAEPE